MEYPRKYKKAAVSIFIVIFTALLVLVITVGFTMIMIRDVQQSSSTDLSQSAYDSAQAGVEDGKRALLAYQYFCGGGGSNSTLCQNFRNNATKCNSSLSIIDTNESNGEVGVSTGNNPKDSEFNQAYTCLKISLSTNDYLGKLSKDASKVISLSGTQTFDQIVVQWYNNDDIPDGTSSLQLTKPSGSQLLLNPDNWKQDRPSLVRLQFIKFNSGGSYNASVFLYPYSQSYFNPTFSSAASIKTPSYAQCSSSTTSGYACSQVVDLGGNTVSPSDTALLRVTALYNSMHYRILLRSSATGQTVQFNNVQPEIDSTGRAGNLFRRLVSRVELGQVNFAYPDNALDTTKSICKDFTVTDKDSSNKFTLSNQSARDCYDSLKN
jgi:hypothetical protein